MAALSITAASVIKGTNSSVTNGTAGATVTAGQVVYLDSTTTTWKLADSDLSGAQAGPFGIALHASLSGQPLQVLTGGPITIGATLTAGLAYYVSPTAGGISPVGDIVSPCKPTLVGLATSTTVLQVQFQESGVAL